MSTPGSTFSRELAWVSATHAAMVGLLLAASLIRGCEAPPDLSTPVEVIVPDFAGEDDSRRSEGKPDEPDVKPPDVKPPDAPPDRGVAVVDTSVKKEKDSGDEKKKPDAKEAKADAKETRKAPPAPKNKVEVSRTLVKRPAGSAGSPRGGSKTKLSAAEIQDLLNRGGKIGKPTLSDAQLKSLVGGTTRYGDGTAMTQEILYLELVRQALYRAWDQPTDIGIAGLVTRVELTLESDGTITSSRMTAGSGNRVMDDSVLRAVRSVRRIPRLPAEFLRGHRRIVVAFELTGTD